MKNSFTLVEHNPEWKYAYAIEAEKIKDILGAQLLEIHHIGSTAIPGLIAKPIIDILVVVKDIKALDVFQKKFEAQEYKWEGEFGIKDRRFIRKLKPDIKDEKEADSIVHIHCFQLGSPDITRHLAFRDYLLKNPDSVKQYAKLKQELLASGISRDQYQDQKAAFIKAIEQTTLKKEKSKT
ncbi:MAG: GrpB family protein [bacterium]